MNAHQRRKAMRKYGRETGLDAVPFGILRLAANGSPEQAGELIRALGIPEPTVIEYWSRLFGAAWVFHAYGTRQEMMAYHLTVERPEWWLEDWTLSFNYHEWRERRAEPGDTSHE